MEPSKDPIAVRITRLNRQILGKVTSGASKLRKTIDREALLDALTVLYDECNDDPVKKCDDLVKSFVDKYRSTLAELRRTRVCYSDFEVLQTIGRGHFGEVHMVREKQTGDVYALKNVRKEAVRARAAGAAEDERDVLANSNSPWLPKLQYAFQDCSNLYLVMELCNGGDLAGLLSRRNHPLSERDAAFYVAETAHALNTLHNMGYVHRDVKPHNILLDRCGHVKLGDLGSCARLSDGSCAEVPVGTADYVAPELLAAADCAQRHSSACDYWSLGVVAFELVTLRRPFSATDDDSISAILANIQKYERDPTGGPPFLPSPDGPSREWRELVSGLLRVQPSRRHSYLDTLQHAALSHLATHSIRDQAPPWVPCLRGAEDASHFSPGPRPPPPPSAAPFRARQPFAGQLPYVGFSYVAPEETEDSSGGFNASHDCTAIDLATFKSAEKLAAMRGREMALLQSKLAAAEATAAAEAEKARRAADAEAERLRARLQAEITALSLQNKRLERQVEVEKDERMALERTIQQLQTNNSERCNIELRAAQATTAELQNERDALKNDMKRLEDKVSELQGECSRAAAAADSARAQQKHYKDTIAKERALRRQTLCGGEHENREAGARAAQAEAKAATEARARELAEKRLAAAQTENDSLKSELEESRRLLASTQETLSEKRRVANSASEQVKELQVQLAQERTRVTSLQAQVQELERAIEEAARREAALEEQSARTESRLNERLEAAETRASNALQDDARHREKVNTLEQLVRQLEREVRALETRGCVGCQAREDAGDSGDAKRDHHSDTESVGDANHAVLAQTVVLKEQLERAEAQLQARAEEIAALRQEARTANLARWRKERENNELSLEVKASARDLKRTEERLTAALEARKIAEQKVSALQSEITTLKPHHERSSNELERIKSLFDKLKKEHETAQAEVDRSRNDIRKLKSELQYSEKRRMHAEEQEELSSRERAQLRDELTEVRSKNHDLEQNNKALQEACSLLEEQLNDLERLADLNEVKNRELEAEMARIRGDLETCRGRLVEAERRVAERGAAAALASQQHEEARDTAQHAQCQLQLLKERLENREARVIELESRTTTLEAERSAAEAALSSAVRRVRELQEECSALRTRAHDHHTHALQLQASLAEAQEEIAAVREASEAATSWWRTRETKADATLRQQAKLIDFLQAKVEEASRKKCSFGNKLFGRSGRRSATSPPLRRANRELREEVDRLRAKLAENAYNGNPYPCTPRSYRDKNKPVNTNGRNGIDTQDANEDTVLVVWADNNRERMKVSNKDGALLLTRGDKEIRARFFSTGAKNLAQNEANRAFTIKLGEGGTGVEAIVVCNNVSQRATLVSSLEPPPVSAVGYNPPLVAHRRKSMPSCALYIAPNAIAIGCTDGLHSIRGPISIDVESHASSARTIEVGGPIERLAVVGGRALLALGAQGSQGGTLLHGGLLALGSALRRAAALKPALSVMQVHLPDTATPHLIQPMSGDHADELSAAVACGRRVFLLQFDASVTEFKMVRSLTVDKVYCLLLTSKAVYIGGEKPLRVNLPSGALETFGMDEPTIAAAAKKHSPPKAMLLIRDDPMEILLCYAECGVFVDGNGKRSRSEDPKWSSAVQGWEFVNPFLYLIGEQKVTIIYINDDAYKVPPCTCDTTSMASSVSECFIPEVYNLKMNEPFLLGTAPNGILVRSKSDDGFNVSIIEGITAFKSVGASVESLDSCSDPRGSLTDLPQSFPDLGPQFVDNPQDMSQESVEPNTGFLADIRKRARQLRKKSRKEPSPEDVIKEILTTEVGLQRRSFGRKSPAMTSEFDSDSETDDPEQNSTDKGTADLCAEMFTRQVRFQ
ncbi:citron Rho-interacting kinase isoform X2 [Hyposmocoma kahamanoa]|uniref:citron Rho-interacting kinase isoform X2 n=1 Tax=Hyposmocoma kahamanoa TaxID=1477025 RepID=UPI000E6D7A19|nr:citron Rho-interacting kinase isoform X2 [Hyposmocoma kahamanoa]